MNIDASIAANLSSTNIDRSLSGAYTSVRGLGASGQKLSADQAEKASKDFEAMFISQMLEPMFGDSIGDEMFGDSETRDVYKGLLMTEYGKIIMKSGGIGIAENVRSQLLKQQEIA